MFSGRNFDIEWTYLPDATLLRSGSDNSDCVSFAVQLMAGLSINPPETWQRLWKLVRGVVFSAICAANQQFSAGSTRVGVNFRFSTPAVMVSLPVCH